MIKKSLLLMLLMALLVPWAANAQETLTVCDGTDNNSNVPFYGLYADTQGAASECVIPSNLLEDMNGGQITAMKFYIKQAAGAAWTGTHQVYLGEVDATTLTGITGPSAFTVVKTASFDATGTELTIEFDEPYTYEGGNLLIGTYVSVAGNWKSAYFYGVTQTENTGWYRGSASATGSAVKFLPKTTFTYEPASSDCPKPASLVASNVTAHTADLTWESEATQFMLQYKKATAETWTTEYPEEETTYTLTGLDPETTYQARVAAHVESCGIDPQTGDDIYSDWREIEFTTGIACPAPTNLAVAETSINAHGATATWNGTSQSYVVMIGEPEIVMGTVGFEDQVIPADFTNDATYPWTVTAGGANSSGYCVIPGNKGVHSSQSDLTCEVAGPCTVSFMAKVSSESGWDKGYFLIDGVEQFNISGTQDWTAYSYELTEGTHALVWRYYKDGSGASGSDLFYVDDITIPVPTVSSWTEYTTNNTTYTFNNLTPNTSYQVKVKGNCGDEGYSQETAPVSFTTLESCVTPTGLAASDITAHEATITWTSDADAWQICVNDDEENLIDVTETTYNFTGLDAETTYTIKVRTDCGNEYSDWTNNMSFTTTVACPAPTGFAAMPNSITGHTADLTWEGTSNSYQVAYRTTAYVDGVEEGFGSTVPEGWTRYNTLLTDEVLNGTTALSSSTSGWNIGTSNGVFDIHARVNIYGSTCKYWLVTPTLTVPAGATFSFDLALTAFSGSNVPAPATTGTDDRFIVLISTDEMATWTILREWNNSGSEYVYNNIANTATGENVSIDITTYVGQDVCIAFYGESTQSNADNNLHLDNVAIGTPVPAGEMQYASNITEQTVTLQGLLAETEYEAWLQGDCGSEGPSTEVGPITFTTDVACPAPTNVQVTNISAYAATLSWTGSSESYNVEYRPAEIAKAGEWGTVTTEDNTIALANLIPETLYEFRIQGNCGDEGNSEYTYGSFTTAEACPMPTGLAVNYTGGITATVTWEGEATSYNIDVNGTVTEDVTSPYTLEGLELATTYEVKVQANCGDNGTSEWTSAVSFTTDLCMPEDMCEITFELVDAWGDGWNGNYLQVVDVTTNTVLAELTNENLNGTTGSGTNEVNTLTLAVCDGREIKFVYMLGSGSNTYPSENFFTIYDVNGEVICQYEQSNNGPVGFEYTYTVSCAVNPCRVPTDLAASEISTFKADLSWTGYHDAYNLQYRHPAAADPTATTATVILTAGDVWGDGSGYQMLLDANATAYGTIIPEIGGAGYISTDGTIGGTAGNVSSSVYGEFEYKIPVNADGALATENIVINDTITIEIPAGTYDWCITNPTSGDRMWIASSNGNVGGRYDDFVFEAGLTYEFTVSSYGSGDAVNLAITPMVDWILVENLTDPSYELTGLDPKTLYEWQVQGISDDCEGGVTEWSASSTFMTDKTYYWDEEATWGGEIPGVYNDVTTPDNIDVVIRAHTIVEAGCVFIGNGGSLTMEPGAQFYHSNDVPVSVKLDIEGYENGSKGDGGYYLISAPAYTNDIDFSIPVDNTNLNTGEFDLYAFDQSCDSAEWRNFKAGAFTALTLGQGYLYANSENINIVFDGQTTPTNADVEIDLHYSTDSVTFRGWNLVGNPFTCTAYTDRPFYTMSAEGDAIVEVNPDEHSVEVMQGIFVVAESEDDNMIFTTTEPQPSAKLTLNLSNGRDIIDRAIVRFDEGRLLPKFQLNPNLTKVYIPMDGKDYAVVRSEEVGELPVNFKAETNGTYNLSFTTEEISFNYLHLIDNMTGNDIDLLATPSYTFEARTNDYANRFKLVFATDILSVSENFAFFSNDNLIISNDGKATVQVIDINGRILSSETINGSASINVKGAAGVYMIRLISGNDVRVQKVVVR